MDTRILALPAAPARACRTRRPFSLSEKMAIVRESLAPGVKATDVARAHGIAPNLVYYWRRLYRELATEDLTRAGLPTPAGEALRDLELQVRNLERLLGQRTLEIALLREQLARLRPDIDANG